MVAQGFLRTAWRRLLHVESTSEALLRKMGV
ncbi:MAG: hypothetical protein QGF67_10755 [Lentisphaeria bacterium]|nr:hypothetical protein [Lentisphaeria bacterium]